MSKYWTIGVPAVLFGLIYYTYTSPGYIGGVVRRIIDPLARPILDFFANVFGLR